MYSILYIGESRCQTTSYHRAKALERLGHKISILSPQELLDRRRFTTIRNIYHYRTGYRFLHKKMYNWLYEKIKPFRQDKPDLIWINGGELLGGLCLQELKTLGCPLLLYNNDDPTGNRDGSRFKTLLKSIPYYDLCVVVREQSKIDFKALKAKNVFRVTMSYDEIFHNFDTKDNIEKKYLSEIAFIGTWMRHEERDKFLLKLIDSGFSISIWGSRWGKSQYWRQLSPYYKGEALKGKEYVEAIRGAKICLGLLSKGNRDEHTTRSMEIPYAGGLLCAERTNEHLSLYNEWEEAVFWSSAEECARVCKVLLDDKILRERIRKAGMDRVRKNKCGNEDICKSILEEINRLGLL